MPRTGERGGPQTRERIREVANRLFTERGYDAVTVAEVARGAGVSSVTVFNHFARKEDLFLDRQADAVELLRSAVEDRAADVDALASLQVVVLRMVEERQPLSGLDPRSAPFYRTVAGSPALVARAREMAAELQAGLGASLARDERFVGDADLFAALFLAGYAAVLVGTGQRMIEGDDYDEVVAAHRERLDALFAALRSGLAA